MDVVNVVLFHLIIISEATNEFSLEIRKIYWIELNAFHMLSSADPCFNGGTCLDQIGDYQCQCVSGFGGRHCQNDIDECASNPCVNNGTCHDYVNSFTCICRAGFSGTHCQFNDDDCTSRLEGMGRGEEKGRGRMESLEILLLGEDFHCQ